MTHTLILAKAQQIPNEVSTPGPIAYTNGREVRLIEPDGSNDHVVWTVPDTVYSVSKLTWSPDGKEIAFASNHEMATSLYERDIFSIRPDGTGLRKLTNPPLHEELTSYAKGTVTVTISNFTGDGGPYFVYVMGAPEPQQVIINPGASKSLVFTDVADFGDEAFQHVVVINGIFRWWDPAVAADVMAGTTMNAGTINMTSALEHFGADGPFWRSDGTRVGFFQTAGFAGTATCIMEQVPVPPPFGFYYDPIFDPDLFETPCVADWAPLPALADQLLVTDYTDYIEKGEVHVYRVTEGSQDKGELVITFDGYVQVYDMRWLPDGSGFLLAKHDALLERGLNLYEYHFADKTLTKITEFTGENEGVRSFSISPDGQFVAFEYVANSDDKIGDVWIMQRDGADKRLLVADAASPHWSVQQPPQPPVAHAGKDTTVNAGESGVARITLDGTASYDVDGEIVRYTWNKEEEQLAEGVQAEVELPVGEHEITLEVEDDEGLTATDLVIVVVKDQTQINEPPMAHAGEDQEMEANENGMAEVTLDGSASSDPDGSIVSYSWKQGEDQIGEGVQPVVELPVGQHQITLTVEDDKGLTATDEVYITIHSPLSAEVGIWLEAECADTIGTKWIQMADASASEGAYITLQEGLSSPDSPPDGVSGRVTYHFGVTQTGVYHIFGRVKANEDANSAFWVRINEGNWMQWDISTSSGEFVWISLQEGVFTFDTEGSQKLEVAYLAGGPLLDKLYITSATTPPSGAGAPAVNCDGSTIIVGIDDYDESIIGEVTVFPNPGTDLFTVRFSDAMPGSYQFRVSTLEGKIVRVYPLQKTFKRFTFDLKGVSPGVYILQIITNEKAITKKIEKL